MPCLQVWGSRLDLPLNFLRPPSCQIIHRKAQSSPRIRSNPRRRRTRARWGCWRYGDTDRSRRLSRTSVSTTPSAPGRQQAGGGEGRSKRPHEAARAATSINHLEARNDGGLLCRNIDVLSRIDAHVEQARASRAVALGAVHLGCLDVLHGRRGVGPQAALP